MSQLLKMEWWIWRMYRVLAVNISTVTRNRVIKKVCAVLSGLFHL